MIDNQISSAAEGTPNRDEDIPPGFAISDPDGCVLDDIQGNILCGYNARFVRHLIVRVADRAAAGNFIAATISGDAKVPQLTTAARWEAGAKPATCLNVGISATGLRALGLDERSLQTFPDEFIEGVASRAGKIGDVDDSAPSLWRDNLGDPDTAHLMWTIHSFATVADLENVADRIEAMWRQSGAFTVTSRLDGATFDTYGDQYADLRARVHFGYRDSISQPRFAVNGERLGAKDSQPLAPVGAVLLGPDFATTLRDVLWQMPKAFHGSREFDIGANGSFNAFRAIEQDTHGFESFLDSAAAVINAELQGRKDAAGGKASSPEAGIEWDKERVAAKLMGRWRNGVPLSISHWTSPGVGSDAYLGSGLPPMLPDADLNNFDYPDQNTSFDDFSGTKCPWGAHVRRANPRGSRIVQRSANYTRPIVRRGIPYGPPYDPANGDDGVKRGLLGNFICASLATQFEAIMYDWVNLGLQDPRVTGTNDPVIGANHPTFSAFSIPIAGGEPIELRGFPRFTETVASVYLFCPSITALRYLANPSSPPPSRPGHRPLPDVAMPAPATHACSSAGTAATGIDEIDEIVVRANSTRWRIRRGVWDKIAVLKYKGQKPEAITAPADDGPRITLVPFTTKHPDIPIDGIVVAKRLPRDEVVRAKQVFTRVQHALVRRYPPILTGLPRVSADGVAALATAYTSAHRSCFPAPVRPTGLDLGALATDSPYASYTHATGAGTYQWDLAHLADYEVHKGLRPLGALVDFALDTATGRLTATRIQTAVGVSTPGSPSWDDATRTAVCAVTTHAAMIRHFNWLHLTAGQVLEAATRNRLPATHPVRRLLWPHVFGTHAGNELVTEVLMSKGGEFDAMFSLTHRAKCQLFESTTGDFDLASINPVLDAQRRGVTELASGARDNWSALYGVLLAHTRRYLGVYYGADDEVANDQALGGWIGDVDRGLPHGVHGVMGETVTIEGVATLLATAIHLATVEHEITGSGLWDYQLWSDVSPTQISLDGRRMPVDVYQRVVNANFNLNVRRAMLLDDGLVKMALDDRGITALVQFQQDLLALQTQYDRVAPAPWRIEPRRLKANINA